MKRILFVISFLLVTVAGFSQGAMIDEIVSVVGSEIILRSEVESQAEQMVMDGLGERGRFTFCRVMEDMMFQKMMLEQARFDSLSVTDEQVESELNRRMDYFMRQFGGKDKMEEYLGKTVDQLKDEFRPSVRDQLMIQQMEGTITGRAKVTPSDVKDFFNAIPIDSLPYIQSEVQIGQIILIPPIRQEEKDRIVKKLSQVRQEILDGSKFSLKAIMYSEDQGSSAAGGELGFMKREDLVPEFSSVAFGLQDPSQISEIVETEYGFHIIQMIERRGEYANFRHILMQPKVSSFDIEKKINTMDSIMIEIKKGRMSFNRAVELYSDDEDTKNNGGILVNPYNGSVLFSMDELSRIDVNTFRIVERLQVGEFSDPHLYDLPGGKKGVRVLYLMKKTDPHVADLSTDYPKIQQMALADKQEKLKLKWVEGAKSDFYIRVEPDYKDCDFKVNWFEKRKMN